MGATFTIGRYSPSPALNPPIPAATSMFASTEPMLTVSMLVSMSSICCSGSGGGSSGSGGFFGFAFFVSNDSSFFIRTKSTNLPSYLEVMAPLPVAIRTCINQRIEKVVNTATIAASTNRLSKAKALISAIHKERDELHKFDKLNAELPKRVVHFDAKISNFLFDNKTCKAKAIIDLDTLMPGTVLSDIGDMIRTYSNVAGEESQAIALVQGDTEIIEHIIDGFLSVSGNMLSAAEKDNLEFSGKALAIIQCIRFLTDYLNNDNYYKVSYSSQNWVRTQNQWALYCSLKG